LNPEFAAACLGSSPERGRCSKGQAETALTAQWRPPRARRNNQTTDRSEPVLGPSWQQRRLGRLSLDEVGGIQFVEV
jgi:hypothetical protein